jgi:phage-related protein (TIGR01555 family)
MVYTFSTTVLATDMSEVLQGDDNGADVLDRADLFTATRSNRGVMLVDKEREELSNVSAPLSGLDEIMTSSLEYLCVISHLPAVVLTGQTPHGLNASAEGELAAFADWISSQQEANIRPVLDTILRVVQASLFGEIDPAIGFRFTPLMQMSAREQAEIRQIDAGVDQQYLDAGILDPSEVRERIMGNDDGYYDNLDPDATPWEDREAEEEAEWATQQPSPEQQQPDGGAE